MKKSLNVLGVTMISFLIICHAVWAESRETGHVITAEELIFIEIPVLVTAARKEQKQSETASAAYVITKEDIRRSGVTTIPELLRMVPGLDVAQIDANKWAISARGFNGRFANKLLVLIDGRSVYSPLFSGVYWDVQDTLLEDVERIEIIRGPGGTLWGSNAVNGIINIITKSAKDTQGGLVTAGAGDQERGFGALRYGTKLGDNAYLRSFAKYFNRDDFPDGHDQWQAQRGGFRVDWDVSFRDELTVLGDFYDGRADQIITTTSLIPPGSLQSEDTIDFDGGNVLLRWQRRLSKESDITLQTYFDNTERSDEVSEQRMNTYDLDFQHRFQCGMNQEIIWGMGYRLISDNLGDSFTVSFDPDRRNTQLFSTFLQDEISLREDLRLTLGTKIEHNDYTGFEVQPSARFLWQLLPNQTLWSAVSRAVRTPSRSDSDIRINAAAFPDRNGTANLISIFGSRNLESEDLLAYEIGYRNTFTPQFSLDVATFYNSYNNLFSQEQVAPSFETDPPPPHLLIPQTFDNLMDGRTYGVEVAANWQAIQNWRLSPGYTWLQMDLHPDSENSDANKDDKVEGSSPEHQFQIRSYLDLPYNLELDTALYYVSRLHYLDVPSYTRLDTRFGWRPRKNLEVSLSVQNLLDSRHQEFIAEDVVGSEVPRSFYAKFTWQF